MNYLKKTFGIAWFGIKNNRVLAGIMLLACVVILPGFTFIDFGGQDAAHIVRDYGICVGYFGGVVIPMVLYSYVQRRRECDFYNSMPVKRSQYFLGYFISGFLLFLVPFTLLTLIHIFTGFGNPFEYYLPVVGMFTIIYCSTITAVMFSGSILSTLVTIVLRNTVAVAVAMLPVIMAGADLSCYMQLLGDKICILSPMTAVVSIGVDEYYVMFWQLILALPELVIGFLLHRFRRSETTTALAFPKTRYPYQYMVMLIAALLVDALILGVTSSDRYLYSEREYVNVFHALTSEEFALLILFTVVTVFVVFIVMNMILDRSGAAAFKRFWNFFVFLAGYVGVLALLFTTVLKSLPPYILPFEPDIAVVQVTVYREGTEEEKEKIISGEWYADGTNLDYMYGRGENEIYVENSKSYCAVTDKEKLETLKQAAQWNNKEGLNLNDSRGNRYPSFENAEEVAYINVFFLKSSDPSIYPKENDDMYDVLRMADNFRIRTGYTTDMEEIFSLTDFALIPPQIGTN